MIRGTVRGRTRHVQTAIENEDIEDMNNVPTGSQLSVWIKRIIALVLALPPRCTCLLPQVMWVC